MRILLTLLAVLAVSATASATDVSRVDVSYKDGEYRVQVEAYFDASRDVVFDILTDYISWPGLSDIIKTSTVEGVDEALRHRVRTVSRGCVLAFCKTVEQVQWMEIGLDGSITAVVVPEESDLRSGWAHTRLETVGGLTRFSYEMVLVPDFWVPPFIGPAVIRYKLRREAEDTARLVDLRARTAQ